MSSLSTPESGALARNIQRRFPLEEDPWSALAEEAGLNRDEVLGQVSRWATGGELREVSAVFEGEVLGYESALVAMSVAELSLERIAHHISAHPTVTHCYERSHKTNLWFTIAVPPTMGLRRTLDLLAEESDLAPASLIPLRRGRTFKIGVSFDLDTRKNDTEVTLGDTRARLSPDAEQISMIRALQTPLPVVERPFHAVAARAGVTSSALLSFAREHLGGAMRRYVGTFRHRRLGVRGNGMVVWDVAEGDLDRVGAALAAAPEVSHCYSRPPFEGFPYSLYSMIHGPDEAAVRAVAERLSAETDSHRYDALFSTREFKKTRLRYFLPELDAWWNERDRGVS